MSGLLEEFDSWLRPSGPAALVIREWLVPVEGRDGVVFPPTFAASKDGPFKGGYNIDRFTDGTNVCLVDTVGSQANRIEPIFAAEPYCGLVPQVVVVAGAKRVNLLEAGHRAADALVRCSELQEELQSAFRAVQSGNAGPLARIAPTSLVFGVWDSRDTQAKLPRLVASTIRAFNVKELTRSAVYIPATDYDKSGLLDEAHDEKIKGAYAERGFAQVPSSATPGGVLADGGIRRDAALHLATLRTLTVDGSGEDVLCFRRYVLGLALTAFSFPASGYLRQGCNLVQDPDKPIECVAVHRDGRREAIALDHGHVIAYARAASKAFDLDPDREIAFWKGPDREVPFDAKAARTELNSGADGDAKKAKKSESRKRL